MTIEPKRDWTQRDIINETKRIHPPGAPGFFNTLSDVCTAAFDRLIDCGPWRWQFPMGDLTVGQVLDFFAEHKRVPAIEWHNTSWGPDPHSRNRRLRRRGRLSRPVSGAVALYR